jgi:hypothetical protein
LFEVRASKDGRKEGTAEARLEAPTLAPFEERVLGFDIEFYLLETL